MTLHSQEREITDVKMSVKEKEQLFSISATATLPTLKDPEEFTCELRIPEANYTVRRETVFYPENEGTTPCSARWLISVCVILLRSGLISKVAGLC